MISTSTFRRSNRGPCALSHGRPSSPSPRKLGYGLSYAGACPLAPCSRRRISSWPLCRSFWLVCLHQRLCSLVVLFSPRPQTGGQAFEVIAPGEAVLLAPAGVVASHRLLPQLLLLVGIHVTLPSPALNQGVELLLDHLSVLYIHH